MRPRVVIADDHPAFVLGLRLGLQDAGIDVVDVAADGEQAVAVAARHRPDAVVLDIRMPRLDGVEACRRIVEEGTAGAVVMLSTYHDAATIRRAKDAGARAFVTKERSVLMLADTITRLVREPRLSLIDAPPLPHLTPRELEVLLALGLGLSNKAIAARLGIGVETVKDHCSTIFGKLEVSDRVQAVIAARRLGLLPD